MKPETQYRLLVKCASADRAVRVLAIGAMNLRKNAAGDAEQNKAHNKAVQQDYNNMGDYYRALAAHDQEIADLRGFNEVQDKKNKSPNAIIPGTKPEEKAKILSAINEDSWRNPNGPTRRSAAPDAQGLMELQQKVNDFYTGHRNWGIGAGIGGGALAGAGTYGALGLIPALKKKKLLRLLAGLGVGGAAGTAIGIGVNNGLNNGSIQGAYNKILNRLA